jgi:hypothetical protein
MMKKIFLLSALLFFYCGNAQTFKDKLKKAKDSLEKKTKAVTGGSESPKLTNEEVIKGLKEALSQGTN